MRMKRIKLTGPVGANDSYCNTQTILAAKKVNVIRQYQAILAWSWPPSLKSLRLLSRKTEVSGKRLAS